MDYRGIISLAEGWAEFSRAYMMHGSFPTEQDRHMFYTGAAVALVVHQNLGDARDELIKELEAFFPAAMQP